jgi:hypothetical protein
MEVAMGEGDKLLMVLLWWGMESQSGIASVEETAKDPTRHKFIV